MDHLDDSGLSRSPEDQELQNDDHEPKFVNGRIVGADHLNEDTTAECPASVMPKSSRSSPDGASPDDQSPVNNDRNLDVPYQPNRRNSLPERRQFNTPISVQHNTPRPVSSGDHRGRARRKTSLPTRPTDLDVHPASTHGADGQNRGRRQRNSESAHLPLEFHDRNHRGSMPKSVSDHRLGSGSKSGASYNPDELDELPSGAEAQLRDTEVVVQTFMAAAYQREMDQIMVAVESDDESPVVAEVPSASATVMTGIISTPDLPPELQRAPLSPSAEVGRRLAMMADEFDRSHGEELDEMARYFLPYILGKRSSASSGGSWASTFEVFRNVARKLFEGFQITWGRIVALLSFGYRLVMAILRAGVPRFVSRIIDFVSRFIIVEPIGNWITTQGGWIQALFFKPTTDDPRLQAVVQVGFWSIQAVAAALLIWFGSGR